MTEDLIEFKGIEPGPVSIIIAGIHGNETCGIHAVDKVMSNLKIEKGTVYFCYGNIRAIEQNVRFTEVNLNRLFKDTYTEDEIKSYEYQRAMVLKEYISKADALLDIHASYVKESIPFLICERNAYDIARYLPVNTVVSGFDNVEPGGTDYYMNKMGGVGMCLECGYLEDVSSDETAIKGIYAFLGARGHIENIELNTEIQRYINMYELYYTKTDNFKLSKSYKDFDVIKKGEVIGIDGDVLVTASADSVILFATNRSKVGEEAYLLGSVI